jgi:hypothetical protein
MAAVTKVDCRHCKGTGVYNYETTRGKFTEMDCHLCEGMGQLYRSGETMLTRSQFAEVSRALQPVLGELQALADELSQGKHMRGDVITRLTELVGKHDTWVKAQF